MNPIILLFKSLIPAHTRRLKTGKVINVRQYTDKRTKRLEDDKTLDMFADDGKDDLFGNEPEPARKLSLVDLLKRGDTKGATDMLRGMSYQEAQETALRAGFSMPHVPKDKRKDGSGIVAALADQLTRAAAQKTDGYGLRDKAKDDDPETALRATWTEQGVPKSRQDELIAQIAGKAKPGAKVGPWTIGGEPSKDTITIPRQELIDEHKRLVDVLESPSRTDDKAEAKKQREELEEYEAKPAAEAKPAPKVTAVTRGGGARTRRRPSRA